MTIRPEIPDVQGVTDPAATKILKAMKNAFDSITGRSQQPIKTLGQDANFFGVVSKVNEIINRLQSNIGVGGVSGVAHPNPTAVSTSTGTFNNVTVGSGGLVTSGTNVAYLTQNQTITLSGDVLGTGTSSMPNTLAQITTASSAGSSSQAATITWDAKGRITSVTTAAITPASIGAISTSSTVTPGTNTKIAYNQEGLVTAGSTASAGDLSNGTTGSGAVVLASAPSIANAALTGVTTASDVAISGQLTATRGGLSILANTTSTGSVNGAVAIQLNGVTKGYVGLDGAGVFSLLDVNGNVKAQILPSGFSMVNTVTTSSAAPSTHKIAMVIGTSTYFLLASNV